MTEKDYKIKDKERLLRDMNSHIDAENSTWEGLFDNLRALHAEFLQCRCQYHASSALLAFYVFMEAMAALPEEGDVVEIVRKMNELMVLREDLTGVPVYAGQEATTAAHRIEEGQVALVEGFGLIGKDDIPSMVVVDRNGGEPVVH